MIGALLAAMLTAGPAPVPVDGRILVTTLVPLQGVEEPLATLTTDLLVGELRQLVGSRVTTEKEVQVSLELDRIRKSAGAEDLVKSAVEAGTALAAPEVITGSLGRSGTRAFVLTLFRVRTIDAAILTRSTRQFSSEHQEELVELMPLVAAELLGMQPRVATREVPRDDGNTRPGAARWALGGVLVGAGAGTLGAALVTGALAGVAAGYGVWMARSVPVFTTGAWLGVGGAGVAGAALGTIALLGMIAGAAVWGWAWRG